MSSLPIRYETLAAALMCVAGLSLTGCASQKPEPYPTAPTKSVSPDAPASAMGSMSMPTSPSSPAAAATPSPTPAPMAMPGKMMMVPAGARVLAAGPLPLPAFYAPPDGGTLYIYDIDANNVAKITSYGPMSGGSDSKPLNLADLPNATNNLDPTHKFRVYYVPTAKAATLPSALPSSQ